MEDHSQDPEHKHEEDRDSSPERHLELADDPDEEEHVSELCDDVDNRDKGPPSKLQTKSARGRIHWF